jgi:pimeloyl-ACP methyl ester carboxylesterase
VASPRAKPTTRAKSERTAGSTSAPRPSGSVDVGAVDLYYERHGRERGGAVPLLLLHGAMGTIESCFARLLPRLARRFEVIAVELQGHGHTRDADRPLTYAGMAADVAALLTRLGIARAHLVGYSMGGGVALQLALDRPELVERLVFAGGASFDPSGLYPELTAHFELFDPHQLDGTPWHEAYRRVAPDPDAWTSLVRKVNRLDRSGEPSWPRERLAALASRGVRTLLVVGDADVVRPEHTIEMFRLLGGGVPGDLGTLPPARLAVLPGTSHVGVIERAEWLAPMIEEFLTAQ